MRNPGNAVRDMIDVKNTGDSTKITCTCDEVTNS